MKIAFSPNLPVPFETLISVLKTLVPEGDCHSYLDYVHKIASTGYLVESERAALATTTLLYATSIDGENFIKKMLSQEGFVTYIDNRILLDYAKNKTPDFLNDALAALMTFPYYKFYQSFRFLFINECKLFFRNIDATLPVANQNWLIVNNTLKLAQELDKNIHLVDFLQAYIEHLEKATNPERVIEKFLSAISPCVLEGIVEIIKLLNKSPLLITTLERILIKYELKDEDIVNVLISLNRLDQGSGPLLAKLINHLNHDQPDYAIYSIVSEVLALSVKERSSFILNNLARAFSIELSRSIQDFLFNLLDYEAQLSCLEWYITHPDFNYGPFLIRFLYNCNEATLSKYLSTSHVIIPDEFLLAICGNIQCDDPTNLVSLLLKRPNYRLNAKEIIKAIHLLFVKSCKTAVEILLKTSNAYQTFSQYYQLGGDNNLPCEYRGTVLPGVIAWYIKNSDKGLEIFNTIPANNVPQLLKRCVPRCIDEKEPSLRVFILQSDNRELITAIGGTSPRLMEVTPASRSIAYLPTLWRAPRVFRFLTEMQRRVAKNYAENHYPKIKETATTLEAKHLYKRCADACRKVLPLLLQHESLVMNAQTAILDGKLKTRLHLEGHAITGKSSNGLDKNIELKNPKSAFTYFTRTPAIDDLSALTTHFSQTSRTDKARIVLNAKHLLAENCQINFMIIGGYQFLPSRTLQLTEDCQLNSEHQFKEDSDNTKVIFNSEQSPIVSIYSALFEFIFKKYIDKLPEHLKVQIIEKLTTPNVDQKLATDLLGLLNLEWLVPGDVSLKLSYVERIEIGEKTYNLSALRELALNNSEAAILEAINAFADIQQFPFVLNGLLTIALSRCHKEIIKRLMQLRAKQPTALEVFYPKEIYQIESLAQLILENFDNNCVFVRFRDNILSIQADLRNDTNRGGVHHAEMPKLHRALDIGNLKNQDALNILLDDKVDIHIEGDTIKSLRAIRHQLLKYELTSLFVSQQNHLYYVQKGTFHPITGKGATNGKVALLEQRLFIDDKPYDITVQYNEDDKELSIKTELLDAPAFIATALNQILDIPKQAITISNNAVHVSISPEDLIAKLRHQAIFYEGINVFTADGRLLLADRRGHGLASAGGHHSDKYRNKGIAYGLKSEFGLVFKNPQAIDECVQLLSYVKTISKTGIYVVPAKWLMPVGSENHFSNPTIETSFRADPEEFVPGSEQALSFVEMRGRKFYDVMPLAELCDIQLTVLKNFVSKSFEGISEQVLFSINTLLEKPEETTPFKVPAQTFGRLTVTIIGKSKNILDEILLRSAQLSQNSDASCRIYTLDESPFALLQLLKNDLQNDVNAANQIGKRLV